jgi:hypothetical protein
MIEQFQQVQQQSAEPLLRPDVISLSGMTDYGRAEA